MLISQPPANSSILTANPFFPSHPVVTYPSQAQAKAGGPVLQQVGWLLRSTIASIPQAISLAMINRREQMTSDTEDDSFHFDEGSESPSQGGAPGARPRVRAEGPGGQDLKRGARIACLECRSAKIRCSAPNDGQVPCKRCSRHDKECVFEKHRRGRKPGRGNLPKDRVDKASKSSNPSCSLRNSSGDHPNADTSPISSCSYQSPSHWLPGNVPGVKPNVSILINPPLHSPGLFSSSPTMGSRDIYRPNLIPYGIDNGRPSLMSRPDPSQPSRAYPGPLPHFPQRDQQFSYQSRHLQSPYDISAAPVSSHGHGYQAPLSSASASSSHGGGFFSPPLHRADVSPFPGSQHSSSQREESRWGPSPNLYRVGLSTPRSLASERSPKRQNDENPQSQSQSHYTVMGPPAQFGRSQASGGSSQRTMPPVQLQVNSSSKLNQISTARERPEVSREAGESDDDEELDELVNEDEVIGSFQDPDVLSRPLQLLAYASTAAARRQTAGGYRDPRGLTAAATLGLVSDSAAAKLKSSLEVAAQKVSIEPASLGAGGAEPSTLENGNWEYKAGRVRAVKGSDASQSPASLEEISRTTSTSMRSGEAQIMEDIGPQLGKRRRSDDEVLPVPTARQLSNIIEQRRMSKLVASDKCGADTELQKDSTINVTHEEQDRIPAGASRKGYFRFSLYASKLDIDDAHDPISREILTLKEMEDLFDLFFNRINPSNFLFDPFLHSLAYVKARSKFLLTVIGSHAARMSEGPRGAELAEKLEDHWRTNLLPGVLIGGYKSIEISQAFLLASLFHRPTHIIVEDRAWQYLGFAIRTATEVGVNICLAPNTEAQDNEHLSRRLRNRDRLWLSLVIAEGTLSTQFGRPCTLLVKHSVSQSSWWNREDFALPEDAALMCQIELRRIVERHTGNFQRCVTTLSTTQKEEQERLVKLRALHKVAWQELESWNKTWCPTGGLDQAGVGGSMAMGAFLVRWSPYSRLIYYYWRSHLNSFILQAADRRDGLSSLVAYDTMQCARNLMAILLDDTQVGDRGLALAPNGVVVMATYAAVSALRLTKLDFSKHAFVDQGAIFDQVHRLAESLEVAGKTPEHRDGAAAPYGTYLLSVLALFDSDSKSSSGASVASEILPGKSSTEGAGVSSRVKSGVTSRASSGANASAAHALATADHLALLSGAGGESDVVTQAGSNLQREDVVMTASHGGPNGDSLVYALAESQTAEASALLQTVTANGDPPGSAPRGLLSAHLGGVHGMSYTGLTGASPLPSPPPPHLAPQQHPAGAMDEVGLAGVYASDSEVWGYLGGDPTANQNALWPPPSTNWSGL